MVSVSLAYAHIPTFMVCDHIATKLHCVWLLLSGAPMAALLILHSLNRWSIYLAESKLDFVFAM